MLYSRGVSLPSLTLLNWWLGVLFEVGLLCVALRRSLVKRLPFFVGYLSLLVANEIIMFGIYRIEGLNSRIYLYSYWLLQFICISLRAALVYEVCRNILSPLVGVWRLANHLLLAIASILGVGVLIAARGAPHYITVAVLTEERGLELVVASLLIAGLAFCRYYRVRVEHYLLWIALGLGFHSTFQVADNTLLQHWSGPWLSHFAIWDALRHFSFDVALMMWVVALWRPLPAVQPRPALLNRNEYENLSPLVTTGLRELNARLLEIWK